MRHMSKLVSAMLFLAGAGAAGAVAAPTKGAPAAAPSAIEQTQFYWNGREYCFYDDGWRGPGWYWCGYAWRRGMGWGGDRAWRDRHYYDFDRRDHREYRDRDRYRDHRDMDRHDMDHRDRSRDHRDMDRRRDTDRDMRGGGDMRGGEPRSGGGEMRNERGRR